MMDGVDLAAYAELLGRNQFGDLVAKVIFLQKEGLSEAQIENIKNLALLTYMVPIFKCMVDRLLTRH